MKCNHCKAELLSSFYYCPSCGKSVRVEEPNEVPSNRPYGRPATCTQTSQITDNKPHSEGDRAKVSKRPRTFADFQAEKGSERTSGSGGKAGDSESSRFTAKKRKRAVEVNVNIGVMAFDKNKKFKPVRAKYLMVNIWPEYNKWQLISEAIKKHTNHDRLFPSSEDWTLVYPDGTEVFTIPGKDNELFTVDGYKKEMCKAYNRIMLFLASRKDVETFEASGKSDSENDIEIVDNAIESLSSGKRESLDMPNAENMSSKQAPDMKLNTLREIFPEREEESLRVAIDSTSNLEEAVHIIAEDNSVPIYTSYANLCREDNESDDPILTPECFFATDKTVFCQNEDLQALLSEHAKKCANEEEYIRMKVRRY